MKHIVNMLLFIAAMSYGQAQTIDPSNMAEVKVPIVPTKVIPLYKEWCMAAVMADAIQIPLVLDSAIITGKRKSGIFPMTAKELSAEKWTAEQIKKINKDTLWDLTIDYLDGSYCEYQTIWHSETKLNDVVVRFGRFHKINEDVAEAKEEWAFYLARGVSKKNKLYEAVSALINSIPPPVCKQ